MEIIKAIKELKTGKSAGPDLLIIDFSVNSCETLTDKLIYTRKAVKIQLIIIEASHC